MKVSMKAYFLLFILVFTACGQMESNTQTVRSTFQEMYNNGEISEEHLAYLEQNASSEILNQSFEITNTSDTSLVMNIGDREIPINLNREDENAPITLDVNGHTLNLKGEETENERNRNILEGILGLLTPNERDDIEEDIGFNLGDLIDLGYSEDRDDAKLIVLGTLVIRALRNFKNENPHKPFFALYAFGNSAEAILQQNDSSVKNNSREEEGNNFKVNASRVISGTGLLISLFDPVIGMIIRILGALVA